MISDSINKFSLSDRGIHQPDYALLSGGARIIPDLTSNTFEIKPKGIIRSTLSTLIGRGNLVIARPPSTVLEPETSIGKCWPMSGNVGQIGIALARKIVVKEIVIEHVEFSLAYELDSAIREFEVLGYDEVSKGWKSLGNGTFEISKSNLKRSIQRFRLNGNEDEIDHQFETGLIVLKVLSNYGNSEFTCLYRVRVLGERERKLEGMDQLIEEV
ncbi:UNC-like C-terminal-domain-containing protein [Melampsora americana]|nr:UNC-like C-terminal-domain-containing protein [Melampsora americana]